MLLEVVTCVGASCSPEKSSDPSVLHLAARGISRCSAAAWAIVVTDTPPQSTARSSVLIFRAIRYVQPATAWCNSDANYYPAVPFRRTSSPNPYLGRHLPSRPQRCPGGVSGPPSCHFRCTAVCGTQRV